MGKAIRCVLPQFVDKGRCCALSANLPYEFVGQQSMWGPTMSKNHLNTEALTTEFGLRTSETRCVSFILPVSSQEFVTPGCGSALHFQK